MFPASSSTRSKPKFPCPGGGPTGADRGPPKIVDLQVLVVAHLLEVGGQQSGERRPVGHAVVLVAALAVADRPFHLLGPVGEDVAVAEPE